MEITLGAIRFVGAIADRKTYEVGVTYGDQETVRVAFTGPIHGNAPIVVVTVDFPGGTWVRNPSRCGEQFNEEWIRNYYTDRGN